MRGRSNLITLIMSLNLAACQTVAMVNGLRLPGQTHSEEGFCGRNLALCLAGGALAVGGIAAAASGGHGIHVPVSASPAATGDPPGTTAGSPGRRSSAVLP